MKMMEVLDFIHIVSVYFSTYHNTFPIHLLKHPSIDLGNIFIECMLYIEY